MALLRAETLKVGSRGAMPSNQIIALVEKTTTVDSWGLTGRRGRLSRHLAERVKRFTGMRGLMEPLRTSRRTSAFTRTSAHNLCFGGASYE